MLGVSATAHKLVLVSIGVVPSRHRFVLRCLSERKCAVFAAISLADTIAYEMHCGVHKMRCKPLNRMQRRCNSNALGAGNDWEIVYRQETLAEDIG